jgi:hypothetical protein
MLWVIHHQSPLWSYHSLPKNQDENTSDGVPLQQLRDGVLFQISKEVNGNGKMSNLRVCREMTQG